MIEALAPGVMSPSAVMVVWPTAWLMLPARKTGAFEVIVNEPAVTPKKSMPIGLSALSDIVRVSEAESGQS